MAFEQTNADIATLKALANGVAAAFASAQSAAASATAAAQQAQSDLTAADGPISTALQEIITILQPLVPAPSA